ncbi:HflC protein [Olavius algarvensis associated proteobacterium Delta 3]|nr:HflC protein [Olavius algarvensis associated proteobacterium Delta 3]
MKLKGALIVVAAALIALVFFSAYTVDETEQVVITQFGKVIGEPKTEPGLYFRVPFIQNASYFPKNLQEWDGDPGQIPTQEKTYIWVDVFARWKIVDPIKFFQVVNNMVSAQGRLDDIIDPAVRNLIAENRLIETVRRTNRELEFELLDSDLKEEVALTNITVGRETIEDSILRQAQPKLKPFGIELVDVKIKRVNYVEDVRKSVYERMMAERNKIAEKYRSEGKGEARKILGDKEKDLKEITSTAYRTAEEIKGDADAEATSIYAEAFGLDPEFYSFLKTLETYNAALGENSSLVLSTDSEFLKYLKGYEPDRKK